MASHERRSVPRPVADGLDIGFKAGFGFYLGIVVAGLTTVAGIAVDASTAAILATAPSTVTAVLLLSLVFGDRFSGLPVRIGKSRRRRLGCYVPSAAFGALLVAPIFVPIDVTGPFYAVTFALVLLTGAVAFGVERMAHNRYVDAITADEPTAAWTWHNTGYQFGERWFTASMVAMAVTGIAIAWAGNRPFGLFWAGYAVLVLLSARTEWGGEWNAFDPSEQWNPPDVRVHDAGLVVDRSFWTTFVPWDAVGDVRLTDDELVIERTRWLDIRCDRASIDDSEATLEEVQRARVRAE